MKKNLFNLKYELSLNFLVSFYFVLYCFILIYKANWGIIDDHNVASYLLKGKNIPFQVFPEIGRFFPLNGFEFNILSKIAVIPELFYAFNALQLIILMFVFFKVMKCLLNVSNNKLLFFLLILTLQVGFVFAWFRLFISERNVLFYSIIFLLFYLKFQTTQKIYFFIISILAANATLYYKEPSFLMIGGFAGLHLLSTWKKTNLKQKVLDLSLLLSTAVFIIIYYFTTFVKKGSVLYGSLLIDPYLRFIKNIFGYILFDPALVLILIPLFVKRLYLIVKNKAKIEPIYDSLLLGALLYILSFFILNMRAFHYFLPAYGFAIPSILYFFHNYDLLKYLFWRLIVVLTFVIIIFNIIPTSIQAIAYYKCVPNNYQLVINFLSNYINKKAKNHEKVNIFLFDLDRNSSKEAYHSFIMFLESKGLNYNHFDVKSNMKERKIYMHEYDSLSKYTIWRKEYQDTIRTGDLLIITPYTNICKNFMKIKEIEKEFEKLYQTQSSIKIPSLSIKTLIETILSKFVEKNQNALKTFYCFSSFDFYVYRKK